MSGYLADRYGLTSGTLTPDEAQTLLSSNGIGQNVATEVTRFLESCDATRYAPSSTADLSPAEVSANVLRWIRLIEGAQR